VLGYLPSLLLLHVVLQLTLLPAADRHSGHQLAFTGLRLARHQPQLPQMVMIVPALLHRWENTAHLLVLRV
jgi:hypothetical protein